MLSGLLFEISVSVFACLAIKMTHLYIYTVIFLRKQHCYLINHTSLGLRNDTIHTYQFFIVYYMQ